MKHYFQKSFDNYRFLDFHLLSFIESGHYDTDVIRDISEIVYVLNPQESEAFTEQIYDYVYWSVVNNPEKKFEDILEDVYKEYHIDKVHFDESIDNLLADEESADDYILSLFIMNINDIAGLRHGYKFFTSKIYNLSEVQSMIDEFAELKKTGTADVNSFVHKWTAEFRKNRELTEKIKRKFETNLRARRAEYCRKIESVAYTAYDDTRDILKDENTYALTHDFQFRDLLRFDDKRLYTEIRITDYETDKSVVVELAAVSMKMLMRKFNYLVDYLEENAEVDFAYDYGFGEVENLPMNQYETDDVDLGEYNEIEDVFEIVDEINKVEKL